MHNRILQCVDEQKDFEVVKKKIISRMRPLQFVSLVHDLKWLLEQAMPDTQGTTCDLLLHHRFLAGLPAQVSKQVRAAGE